MTCAGSELFDELILSHVRECFCNVDSDPISGRRIYLENAGGGLTLKKVVEVVAEQTALPDNAGRANPTSRAIDALIAKGKEDLRILLGAQAGTVFVGESTTSNVFQVLGAIMRGVPGTNVVTTNLDHPAVYDSTRFLAERFGQEWRCAELCPRTGRVEWESVARQVDARTSVLAIIHSSNITGAKNAVASIIRAARKIRPDLYVVVDGAQHGSHGLVDVEQLGCDAYFLSSYKLFSKIGASAFYLSDRAARLPHDRLLGKPETSWEMGTREQAGYAAWSEVLDYFSWLGSHFTAESSRRKQVVAAMNAIELHERALTSRVLHGWHGATGLLDMPHVMVYGETRALELREPCITFNVKGMTSAAVVSYLGENGIWAHNRVSDAYSRHTLQALGIEECVRVSLAHYNSPAEVDAFLGALEKVAA